MAKTTIKRKRTTSSTTTRSRKRRKPTRNSKIRKAKATVGRNIVTDQFDKRVDYVYVRKPVKQKEINFKNKVMSVLATQQPVVTKVFTIGTASTSTTSVTEQAWQIFHLKPWNGLAATPGAGSLFNEVAQTDLATMSTDLQNAGLSDNYWIKQAWMDVYCENTSAADSVLEVYELEYVRRAGAPISEYASFNAALTAALTATTTAGTAYSLNTRSITPFDIAALLRDFGIRVVKKMTSDLQSNGKFIYPLKDYRKHYISADALIPSVGGGNVFAIEGVTRSILCIAKAVQNDGAVTLRASADKHYRIQPTNPRQDETVGGQN